MPSYRLLGVMVPDRYRAVTSEMFELFKTCWEPVQDDVGQERADVTVDRPSCV